MAPTPMPLPSGGLPDAQKQELLARVQAEQAAKAQGTQQMLVWFPGQSGTRKTRGNPDMPDRGGDFAEHGRTGGFETFRSPDSERVMEGVQAWAFDPQKRADIIAKLRKLGYDTSNPDDVDKLWYQAVADASFAFMNSGQKQKVSPWDILNMRKPEPEAVKLPPKGLSWSRTTDQVDMAEMPPEVAKGALRGSLREILGRDPTDSEINDFASRAAAIAAENPYTRSTTSRMQWDPELEQYVETGSTTTESGVSQEELNARMQTMATEETEATSEAGTYEAATRGMNALMEVVGG